MTAIETYETSDPTPSAGAGSTPDRFRYAERFWTFTAGATGLIRFDALGTVNTDTPGWLGPVEIDVLRGDGTSIGMVEGADTDVPDTVWYVEAGETYTVVVYVDGEAWEPYFIYRLRSGGIQGGESVQVPPVMVSGEAETTTKVGGMTFLHSGSFPHPGTQRDAIECAWRHARRRADPRPAGPFWTGTCPTLVLREFAPGSSTGTTEAGTGTGLVGWRYRVDADESLVAGSMDFTVYMPYAHLSPAGQFYDGQTDLLGNQEGEPFRHVWDIYGDDVLVMQDPLPGTREFDVTSMEVAGGVSESAAIGGVGSSEPRWYWGYVGDSFTDVANTVSLGGLSGGNFARDDWEPISPEASGFAAFGINVQTSTDAPPKINETDDLPLGSADYVVSGTWSGQYVKWRATLQPREFLIYRRPPPAGGIPKQPRLRHLNIAPDRRGENWRGTSLRRISSYQ